MQLRYHGTLIDSCHVYVHCNDSVATLEMTLKEGVDYSEWRYSIDPEEGYLDFRLISSEEEGRKKLIDQLFLYPETEQEKDILRGKESYYEGVGEIKFSFIDDCEFNTAYLTEGELDSYQNS